MARTSGLRDRKKLQTFRTIRAAAFDLFLNHGYDAVSADDIAAAAEVSHSTFFNYFTCKESVVFDPDPEHKSEAQALLAARPADEPLWTSLREVVLNHLTGLGERLVLVKQLTAASPTLALSRRAVADRVHDELLEWARARNAGSSPLESALLVNIAMASVDTAFAVWDADDGIARFGELARECLDRAAAGLGPTAPT